MTSSRPSRRQEALALAEQLLGEIELSQILPIEIARRTYRLARLLEDRDAVAWLGYEVNGYKLLQPSNTFDREGWEAALRSNRDSFDTEGKHTASASSLGELQADVEAAKIQLAAAADRPVSVQSANPNQIVHPPANNGLERAGIRIYLTGRQALIDKVVGSMHSYVVERYDELRFGSAVESAFDLVREDVDARIAELIPEAPGMLAAAFESAASENPEHWSSAAAGCRRLLKAAADALRPPSEPKNGRPMTDSHYINRLVDWIVDRSPSDTDAALTTAELEHLGARLDAVDGAGQKGAHDSVERSEAARFLTGTYLLLGDVLRLAREGATEQATTGPVGHGAVTELSQGETPSDIGTIAGE
jgi:hypothetical protein